MRVLLWLLAALSWIVVVTHSWRIGPLPAASITIVAAILLAASVSHRVSVEGVMAASIGALMAELLGASALPVSLGVATAGIFFERTLRVRSRRAKAVHAGLSAISGAIAALVTRSYSGAAWPLQAASIVFAAAVLASPFLIDADDAIASRLAWAAHAIGGRTGLRLEQAAELRRQAADASLDSGTMRTAEAAWQSLARVVEERARLGSGQATPFAVRKIARIDSDLDRYVVSLERLFAAADGLHVMRDAADEAALDEAHAAGSALEEVQRIVL